MHHSLMRFTIAIVVTGAASVVAVHSPLHAQDGIRFHSGVDLVNIIATVTDRAGRFVSGLTQRDFVVYEDDRIVDVSLFSAGRVPISLGLVLDVSESMVGKKITHACGAIERFLDQLGPDDEVFLYSFAGNINLVQDWTTNRDDVRAGLQRLNAAGGTAMYDAVMEAVPMAQSGRNRKKAVVVISDGNDTNSRADIDDVRQVVRATEVLIYAVGIDGQGEPVDRRRTPRINFPRMPMPMPGPSRPRMPWPVMPQLASSVGSVGVTDSLNMSALRELTDASGGRTEVVRRSRDLAPVTTAIADELTKQYYLGYASPGSGDGRWHAIRVELSNRSLRVRARSGYTADVRGPELTVQKPGNSR
jgi:Ca-activated chloride channel homolog